jgi:uncharacterized protein
MGVSPVSTLLTPKEVAERLRVSQRTVYLWIEGGRLPSVRLSARITRVPADAIDAFVSDAYRSATAAPPIAAEAAAAYDVAAGPAAGAAPQETRTPTERLRALLDEHREDILALAEKRRAGNVRVFGSVVRGDAREDSDIDLLVDLKPHASLFDLGGLNYELEEMLGVRVDVVPAKNVKERIRDRIFAEAIPL